MYCLLFVAALFHLIGSRPIVENATCTAVPVGSIYIDTMNQTVATVLPLVADKCTLVIDYMNPAAQRTVEVNCTPGGNVSYQNWYAGLNFDGTCNGLPLAVAQVKLSGPCYTLGCIRGNFLFYQSENCAAPLAWEAIGHYEQWYPNGTCINNQTQSCVNGVPVAKMYNNSACTGAFTTVESGVCNSPAVMPPLPGLRSSKFIANPNPC
eukprot:UN02606